MGLAVTIACALLMGVLAIAARSSLVYVFLFLIVFFEEFGTGFTSFSGSFVFNQSFVDLFNLKFIEIITAAAYIPVVITHKRAKPFMGYEKWLGFLFAILVIALLFIEYTQHLTVTVSDWRLIITGAMLLHLMAMLQDTEQKLITFTKVFLLMLTIRALIGLAAFALGYGIQSPRGMVPFFWDSRQIDGFVFGVILVFGYIMHYRALPANNRIFSQGLAVTIFAILSLTVLLSVRRTLWYEMAAGVILCIITSRQARIRHYLVIGMTVTIGITVVATVPALEGFRDRMGSYLESTNLLDKSVAKERENEAHIDNVQQYFRMVIQDPRVLFMGYRGRSGEDYRIFKAASGSEGPLGTAHNGILATLQFFGIVGLLIYMLFYLRSIFLYRRVSRLPSSSPMRYISMGSLIFLFLEFIPSLFFVPPFYNSIKGVVYIFLSLFLLRASIYYSNPQLRESEDRIPAAGKEKKIGIRSAQTTMKSDAIRRTRLGDHQPLR